MSTAGKHLVFYAGLLYGEYDLWPPVAQLPDGAYIRAKTGHWYCLIHGGPSPINLCDVPLELRTTLLLLGL